MNLSTARSIRRDCARARLPHDIRHHIRHVHLTCGAVATKYKQINRLAMRKASPVAGVAGDCGRPARDF
jgi:hypothetical protein